MIVKFVANKAEGRISKRVFQENKARQFFSNFSHPIQFRLGSKIKRSISKLWKTIVPAKNEN